MGKNAYHRSAEKLNVQEETHLSARLQNSFQILRAKYYIPCEITFY